MPTTQDKVAAPSSSLAALAGEIWVGDVRGLVDLR